MIYIDSLVNTSFEQLYSAFSTAFAEYEVQQTSAQLRNMLQRRGFNPQLSFGAFDDGKLVSFICNGIGYFDDKQTAYDTGTGTLKEYRGQGLIGDIFKYSLPFLREAGLKQCLLEVLKSNDPAVSVYRKQGFEVVREFSYFTGERPNFVVDKMNNINAVSVVNTDMESVSKLTSWWDFQPSWQNSFEAVARHSDSFVIKLALIDNVSSGYCIFEPLSGDITQIAVNPECRQQGIATMLLVEVLKECKNSRLKLVNTDNNYPVINHWAESVGLIKRGEQFEMILNL
jgi:ribosomal protein S18 acetylase RimI-like enzyme